MGTRIVFAPAVLAIFLPSAPVSAAFYLHGTGPNANPPVLFLDTTAPAATTAKYRDSVGINFSGGSPWKEVGTWTIPATGALTALNDLHVWLGLKNSDDIETRFDPLRGAEYTLPSGRGIPDGIFVNIAADNIGLALATTEEAPHTRNPFCLGTGASTANGIAFHVLVEHLIGVEVGKVAGQAEQFDPLGVCAHPSRDACGPVNRMAVHVQENLPRNLADQSFAVAARAARCPLKGTPRGKSKINIVRASDRAVSCSRLRPPWWGLRMLRAEPSESVVGSKHRS